MEEGGNTIGKRYPANDFIPVLKDKLGIEAADVWIMKRSDSIFATEKKYRLVPYLDIKAKQADYEKIVCDYRPQGLVNEEYYKKISAVWLDHVSAKYEDYGEYYDPKMFIGTDCFDDECFEMFAREQKKLVEQYLKESLGKAPDRIYASSVPGIYIVYSTVDYLFLNLGKEERRNRIRDGIIGIARDHVEKKYGSLTCNLEVKIYHPHMKEYNGYGLSRED